MNAEAILGLATPVTYILLAVIERLFPARKFPDVRRWRLVGLGFFLLIGTVSSVAPLLLPVEWLARHRLVDGTRLGVVGGVLVGLLVGELLNYWVHRLAHRLDPMWRWMHQLHHASPRIDIASSAVFHPTEMAFSAVFGVVVGTFVLGLDPLAAGILGYLAGFFGMFQHWNVRTPRWLGLFIQRPEAHCIHHEKNVHAYNYGNIPVWDVVFGTYKNPESFEGTVGFEAPLRFAPMLIGRDVSGGLGDGIERRKQASVVEVAS